MTGFLPSISYLTRLDKLVLGATVLVFAALLEVIYTHSLVSRGKSERALAVDRKCRVAFPALFVALFVVTILF